jgi:F0F1-type ATP synthase assembly protein I
MSSYGNGAAETATGKTTARKTTVRAIMAKESRAQERASRAMGLEAGWTVFSYMISGMAAYGIIGWLIGRAVHIGLLFPLGMVAGLGISVGFVIYRYGKQASVEHRHGGRAAGSRKE